MHTCYRDILDRIDTPPLWFDEVAVPRFELFEPRLMANIYAREAVLARIECQACSQPFDVAFSRPMGLSPDFFGAGRQGPVGLLRHDITTRRLHFGDPPNTGCCHAGPTMNSVPRQVLEYWVKPYALGQGVASDGTIRGRNAMDWRRDAAFEVDITPGWAR